VALIMMLPNEVSTTEQLEVLGGAVWAPIRASILAWTEKASKGEYLLITRIIINKRWQLSIAACPFVFDIAMVNRVVCFVFLNLSTIWKTGTTGWSRNKTRL
jgi:hypothetical protein